MITDDSLKRRIEIARAATQGTWDNYFGFDPCAVFAEAAPGRRDLIADRINSMHDAEHIAANHPQAVIELCEGLISTREKLQQEIKSHVALRTGALARIRKLEATVKKLEEMVAPGFCFHDWQSLPTPDNSPGIKCTKCGEVSL